MRIISPQAFEPEIADAFSEAVISSTGEKVRQYFYCLTVLLGKEVILPAMVRT